MNIQQLVRLWRLLPIVLIGLIGVLTLFESGENRLRLPLRSFVQEVEAGNVSDVKLDGRILSYRLRDTPAANF